LKKIFIYWRNDMCGTWDRLSGKTDADKRKRAARAAAAKVERERAAQQAEADAQLAKQQELADAKMAFEKGKTKERAFRLSRKGGGLSTKYSGANLGGSTDKLGG
jgi:hypothetical protein